MCGNSNGIGTSCGSCVDGCSPRGSILTKQYINCRIFDPLLKPHVANVAGFFFEVLKFQEFCG